MSDTSCMCSQICSLDSMKRKDDEHEHEQNPYVDRLRAHQQDTTNPDTTPHLLERDPRD